MTDLTLPTRVMPNPLNPLRLAWRARNAWHRVARPLTMGVRAIILDKRGDGDRVLLIRHSYVPGWHLPGGGVGKGETLLEAMKREVREEVGLSVEAAGQPLGMYARFRSGASDHVAVFVVQSWSGTPRPTGSRSPTSAFSRSTGCRRTPPRRRGGGSPSTAGWRPCRNAGDGALVTFMLHRG